MTLVNVESNDRTIPKLAVSRLAKSYHHRCEKHVKLVASKSGTASGATVGLWKEAHFQRGYQFEEQVAESYGVKLVDHTNTPPSKCKQALRDAEPGQVLYQLTFEMPDKFYQEQAGNAYRLGRFIPDFLFVEKDTSSSAGKRIRIVDAKSSKAMNTSHQFQVASYAYLLGYIVKDIRNIRIDAIGGVLLPFSDEPEMFRVDLLLPKIELFYTRELSDIVKNKQLHWLFNSKCKNCEFVNVCREDAYGTPGAVPYLTEHHLKTLTPPDDVSDIEDLVGHLSSLSIQERRERAVPSYMASEGQYADYAAAYQTQQPQFRGNPIVTLAKTNDHDIFISLMVDPMYCRLCAYAIRVYDLQSETWCQNLEASSHVSATARSYSQFIELDAKMIQDLVKVLSYMETKKSRCTIFLASNQAKEQVQKCCLRLTTLDATDDDSVDQDTVQQAMDCLLTLFHDTKMLAIPGIEEFPASLEHKVLTPLVVDVERLVRENVALGVPGFYSLQSMARWMAPDHETMSDDDLYEEWHTAADNTDIDDLLMAQADVLHAIVTKYRSLASQYERDTRQEVYCIGNVPFIWPKTQHFRSNVFGRLAFFKIMECLSGCNNVRSSRLLDLANVASSENHGILLQFIQYQVIPNPTSKKPDNKRFLCCFKAIQENRMPIKILTDSLSKSAMREYLLVSADRAGIMQAVKFPDLAFRGKMYFKYDINSVDVQHVSDNGIDIVLEGYTGSPKLQKSQFYRLYKRYVDFNTDKILDAMLQIDQRENSTFEQLVADPNAWADTSLVNDAVSSDARATALRLRDDFRMSPSQKDISAQIIEKRLQIVWGPPGSGKTEFLALFINWYIMHLFKETSSSDPFIIGVTAFTRHAIMNLLQRIATVRQRHDCTDSFTIISMEGYENSHENNEMIQCKAKDLKKRIKTHKGPLVIGGTVWDWYKIKSEWRTWQGCNMMIIDESSQLLVSDAAVAVDCLNQKQGRLIIAGDHMQLGPILHNKYPKLPASDPLLFGSIQQCLMRTEDNKAIPPQEFLLRKGATHDFGRNTIQLKDNWRMNEGLNSFFKQVYGDDLAAHYPKRILQHDWQKWKMDNVSQLQAALDPKKSISLVKINMNDDDMTEEEIEAQVIAKLVHAHLTTRVDPTATTSKNIKPHVMVVTPHHRQRVAVEHQLEQCVPMNQVTVDTVEKMQGQESELVIACFAFNDVGGKIDFLLDFKRWNVAISRARSKVIIVTTDYMLNLPKNKGHNALDLFEKRENAEGWGFVCLLQDWAKKADAVIEWSINSV
ncbi:P-loop containing nucleoside triphosphate hydrolase protein [Lichtheimia hyalospora FSU 10163]|nr:P-loop containing nucleoside triphosphate hydrolase protein [Lichtheimia hyalospora FSU 10163]